MILDCFNKWIRPEIRIGRKRHSTFRVCGYLGFTCALALALLLTVERGFDARVTLSLVGLAALSFLMFAMCTKIVSGEEKLIFYHHLIFVLTAAAVFLYLTGRPVLPYLDISAMAVGLFLAFGRVGCLMVGCCHGRPSRLGVTYRSEHARAGFEGCYVGAPLFPVQALEALYVAGIVTVGSWLVLRGSAPGTALAWFVTAYGLGRFGIELLRGDAERRYLAGFSEPQWTALISVLVTAVARPADLGHAWATGLLIASAIAIFAIRRMSSTGRHRLLHPRHVREIAEALRGDARPADAIRVRRTSLGVTLSGGTVEMGARRLCHYSLSRTGASLAEEQASILAALILRLKPPAGKIYFHRTERGVFQIVTTREQS